MKKPEDIISLITSLSGSEKRYFKLFVKNRKGKNDRYIKLFDLIDKAGTSEREVLQKLNKNDNFLGKHFNTHKYRLYNQILDSLCSFHAEESVDDKIMELIRKAKILVNKTLYSQATNELEKAKSIALKYEKHTLLLEIVRWEKKIFDVRMHREIPCEKEVVELFEEETEIVNRINNYNEYGKQRSLMYLYYRIYGIIRIKEDVIRYKEIINAPYLTNQQLALSYWSKKEFYITHTLYSIAVNNIEQAYIYAKNAVSLMETNLHQIKDDPTYYYPVLHNFLFAVYKMKRYDELFNLIDKYKLKFKEFKLHPSSLIMFYNLEFSTYIDIGQYNKAILMLSEIESVLYDKNNKNEVNKLLFISNKAFLYFGKGDYHNAIVNVNIILNDKNNHLSQDVYSLIRIFNLIIHFEKGNIDLLPYLLKSLYRFLMQKKKLHETEKKILKFIGEIIFSRKNTIGYIEHFKILKRELLNVSDDPMEARFMEVFDIISWLDSKIEYRPFGEILREKSGYTLEE